MRRRTEPSDLSEIGDLVGQHLKDNAGSRVVAGVDVGQLRGIVATATSPADVLKVRRVVDTEVLEGREEAAFERLPEP